MGITVRERAPTEEDTFLLTAQPAVDDTTVEEATAALTSPVDFLVAPPIPYVCICVKWAPLNY